MHPVHPSLYGRYSIMCVFLCDFKVFCRDDCFVVMLQYLNELFYHYICAGTAETAQVYIF